VAREVVDNAVVTVEEEADIVSTMKMPNRQKEVCHLEIDLKERTKKVATEVAIAAVEGVVDIVSTMKMPNRQREVSHLEIDLKERTKKVATEVAIVAVEGAVDIAETDLIDSKDLTPSGETSQPKVVFPMLKAVHRKIDLPESTTKQKKVKKVERDLLTDRESSTKMIPERIR
jgi:hypothetical protein